MGLADWNATVISIPHGGKGSGCCAFCDPDLELLVDFEDGTVGVARHFKTSKLGKGFVVAEVRFAGTNRFKHNVVITPRDGLRRA